MKIQINSEDLRRKPVKTQFFDSSYRVCKAHKAAEAKHIICINLLGLLY